MSESHDSIAREPPGQPAAELVGAGVMRGDRWIVREIDWQVQAGECAALLGANGSGKSTIARMICGYVWPTVGRVSVSGSPLGAVEMNLLRERVRLVQSAGPFDADPGMTVRDVVMSGRSGTIGLFGSGTDNLRARADTLIDEVGLRRLADNRYGTLSSGERVRALLARAMVRPVDLLLLDEPTAGLDLLAREQVLMAIDGLSRRPLPRPATIIITHHVEELPPTVTNVLLLREGQAVARGLPSQVLTSRVLSEAYGVGVEVDFRAGRWWTRVDATAWRDLERPSVEM